MGDLPNDVRTHYTSSGVTAEIALYASISYFNNFMKYIKSLVVILISALIFHQIYTLFGFLSRFYTDPKISDLQQMVAGGNTDKIAELNRYQNITMLTLNTDVYNIVAVVGAIVGIFISYKLFFKK